MITHGTTTHVPLLPINQNTLEGTQTTNRRSSQAPLLQQLPPQIHGPSHARQKAESLMTQNHDNQDRGCLLEQRVTWTDLERRRRNRQAIAELRHKLLRTTDSDEIELILLKLRSLEDGGENSTII